MKLLVFGGTGYLGRELCRLAQTSGCDVLQAGHSSDLGAPVDVRDRAAVERLVAEVAPDAVVNLAYVQEGPDAWSVTVDGAVNVAAAVDGVRLIHLSTDVVFDGRKGSPYVEEDESCPVTEYGRAKAESERRVRAAHSRALVVRTSLIVGGPGHEPSKHELAAVDPAMTFYEDEIRCPIQVGDLASALLELARLDRTGILHVAGADSVSRADLAELEVGRPVRRVPAPPGRPLDCTLDCSRANALLRVELRGVRSVFASRDRE